ncbi:MAG: EAL domain-containing protein [Nevskia sp.]|nr:EAL domain-containing protein [Nevskia sp.]
MRRYERGAEPRRSAAHASYVLSAQGVARRSREENRLLQAMASAGTGIWEWDTATDRLHLSEALAFMFFGVAQDLADVPLQTVMEAVDESDRARLQETLRTALEQHTEYEIECRLAGADGAEQRWFVARGCPEYDAQGRPCRVLGTATDITQRMQAQIRLKASEERLRTLVESTTQMLWMADPAGGLTEVSAAFKRIAGLDPERALASNWIELVRPDFRERTLASWRQALATGVTYDAEFPVRVADGSYRFFRAQAAALRNPGGRIREWVGTLTDIDAQKRAEDALQASEQKLESILDSMTEVVWSLSASTGRLTYLGPAVEELTGVAAAELMRNPGLWGRLVHPADRAIADPRLEKLRTAGALDVEYRIVRPDGEERWVQSRGKAIYDGAGRLVRMDGIVKDITRRKAQEQRLVRLNRVHAVLSGINALIVRAGSREQLFQEACRIAVEQGGFRLAWIGVVIGDEVRPVAVRGEDHGYVDENIRISLSGRDPRGNGPAADALRALRTRVCNDIAADAQMRPWRDAALRRGLRSVAVFPLVVHDALAGSIGLYAGETGFFDEDELRLLSELAGDIAFAMESLAHRQELEYLAYYDSLTGLANRRMFAERLNRLMPAARENGDGAAAVLVDLAHFKTVNDTLGMAAGDELLKMVARRLVRLAGGRHNVARLGSDRFAVAVPGVRSQADLAPLLRERPWNMLNRPYRLRGQSLHVPARAGIALFPQDAADADTLIQNAEAALKKAKASGERYLLYAQEMSAGLKQKLHAETRLRRAVDEQEFVLHYQPRVDLRDGAICGVEALLRWRCPQRGLVAPGDFIGDLEETGLIVEAGRWVLQRAAADYRRWVAQGLPAPRIAVNVSAVQLRQPDFVECLRGIACEPGAAAAGLELEVTESMLMQDIERKIVQLREVREMGIPVAIDDFGTGYSSLSYLSRLPISTIKVDRSFVETLTTSPDTMGIVSTIISLAHSMSLRVVAEGVETNEQLKFLRLLRCDEMQGYLFSKPLPEAQLAEMLRQGARP